MKKKISTSIRPTLKAMKILTKTYFPVDKSGNVRSTCTSLSLSTGMKFTTQQLNAEKLIEVTRTE